MDKGRWGKGGGAVRTPTLPEEIMARCEGRLPGCRGQTGTDQVARQESEADLQIWLDVRECFFALRSFCALILLFRFRRGCCFFFPPGLAYKALANWINGEEQDEPPRIDRCMAEILIM